MGYGDCSEDTIKSVRNQIFVCLIGVLIVCIFLGIAFKNNKDELNQIKPEYLKLKKFKTVCVNVQKTLTIAYDLSDWEAEIYAYMFVRLSTYPKNFPFDDYFLYIPAIINVESHWNVLAKSSKDAKGLMQVLEGTAEKTCKRLGIRYREDQILWNEINNILIGTDYFVEGISKAGFNCEDGIKRYIGGAGYSKANEKYKKIINNYYYKVNKEFLKLQYIYKGVQCERSNNE